MGQRNGTVYNHDDDDECTLYMAPFKDKQKKVSHKTMFDSHITQNIKTCCIWKRTHTHMPVVVSLFKTSVLNEFDFVGREAASEKRKGQTKSLG